MPWDEDHVFYVWYDALINYATAAGFGVDDEAEFEKWWPEAHHIIGKDILRFHCVYWPAMLIAAGLQPPKQVHVSGFLPARAERSFPRPASLRLPPLILSRTLALTDFAITSCGMCPLALTASFPTRAWSPVTTRIWPIHLGNLLSRVATVVGKKCGGSRPRSAAPTALWREFAVRRL